MIAGNVPGVGVVDEQVLGIRPWPAVRAVLDDAPVVEGGAVEVELERMGEAQVGLAGGQRDARPHGHIGVRLDGVVLARKGGTCRWPRTSCLDPTCWTRTASPRSISSPRPRSRRRRGRPAWRPPRTPERRPRAGRRGAGGSSRWRRPRDLGAVSGRDPVRADQRRAGLPEGVVQVGVVAAGGQELRIRNIENQRGLLESSDPTTCPLNVPRR